MSWKAFFAMTVLVAVAVVTGALAGHQFTQKGFDPSGSVAFVLISAIAGLGGELVAFASGYKAGKGHPEVAGDFSTGSVLYRRPLVRLDPAPREGVQMCFIFVSEINDSGSPEEEVHCVHTTDTRWASDGTPYLLVVENASGEKSFQPMSK